MSSVLRVIGVVFGLIVFDQASKVVARSLLTMGQPVPVIGNDFFRLTLVENPGVAFGLRLASPIILLIFSLVAAALLTYFLVQLTRNNSPMRYPIVLLLAGAMGNSIDRILFGHVTDFLDFDFPDFIMQRWPVFNVADSCVTVGMILLVLVTVFGKHSSPHPDPEPTNEPS